MVTFNRELSGYRLMSGDDINPLVDTLNALLGQAGAAAIPLYAKYLYESAADGLVATGSTQATSLQLASEVSRIATVAVGSGVMLPSSAAGLTVLVINHGANPLQVYGSGTDTIDDVATATGVSQMAGSNCLYVCSTAGLWYTNGIGTGYAGSLPTVSYANGITATPSGTQGSSFQLAANNSRITTVATIGDSVKLPMSSPGLQIVIANAAVNSANVFPQVGDTIDALGINTARAVAGNKTATFYCFNPGNWHSLISA